MFKKVFVIFITVMFLQGTVFAKTLMNKENDMTREEICKENYKTLFKGEALSKEGADPEMLAILQKYIFGEVFTIGNLDIKTRELLTVTSLAYQQTLPQLKAHANAALNVGVTPLELREAIYQLAPFMGFPKTLNALGTINEVFNERGIKTPLEDASTTNEENRSEKGAQIQNPLYGDEIKVLLKGLPDNMGDEVARMLTEVCFGDFYTRKALDTKTRELLIISALVTSGNVDTLKKHIKGNLKAGNSKETICAAIIQCLPYTGFPNAISALNALKEILEKEK